MMSATNPIIRSDSYEPEAADALIGEELMSTFVASNLIFEFVLDHASRRFLLLRGAFEEFYDLTREQMLADPEAWTKSLDPLDQVVAVAKWSDLEHRGANFRVARATGRGGIKRTLSASVVMRQVGGRKFAVGSVREVYSNAKSGVSVVLSTAVEEAHDGIGVTDAEGNYLFLNREHVALFGYETMNELIGKSWRSLYSDEMVRHIEQVVFPELEAKGRWRGRLQAKRKDGSLFIEGLSLTSLSGGGLVCNCQDVTAQVQMEANLEQTARRRDEYLLMQREFISMVSHEFRTPLTAIQGLQYLMQKRISSETEASSAPAGFNRWLDLQGQALETLKELVDQVLQLNRVEHMASAAPQRFALGAAIKKIIVSLEISTGKKRINLELDLPGEATALLCEYQMRALVENLVSNALKYSSGLVTVQVGIEGNHWWLSVEDRGRGVPQQDQAKLFQSFFRAGNVGNVPGTGLGLTIVQRCAAFHNGTVELVSREGVGSKFTVKFPHALPEHWPPAGVASPMG